MGSRPQHAWLQTGGKKDFRHVLHPWKWMNGTVSNSFGGADDKMFLFSMTAKNGMLGLVYHMPLLHLKDELLLPACLAFCKHVRSPRMLNFMEI